MPASLNFQAKRVMLGQSIYVLTPLDHSDLFVKLLLLNKSFLNIRQFYKICQLIINMDRESDVSFSFGINRWIRTRFFRFSPEQARKLINLFKIQSLEIYCPLSCGYQFDEYWPLIDCVEGKIDLQFQGHDDESADVPMDVVTRFWDKITSLGGDSKLFRSNWCQSRKHFDKIYVQDVYNIADLKRILRHDVDKLEICFSGELSMEEVDEFVKTADKIKIKRCLLSRSFASPETDVIFPLIHCIMGVSPTCSNLEIDFYATMSKVVNTTDELIASISEDYEIFSRLKPLLSALPFNLTFCITSILKITLSYESQDFGNVWFNRLKQNNSAFSKSVIENIEGANGPYSKTFIRTEDDALLSIFRIGVSYQVN